MMKVLLFVASSFLPAVLADCDPLRLNECNVNDPNDKGKMCDCLRNLIDFMKTCDDPIYKMSIEASEKVYKEECGGCFPASSLVELIDGKFKSMDQLAIGDKVRVTDNEFSEVYYFSTLLAETTSKFVRITTQETQLHLTAGHYLYINGDLLEAKAVKVGDVVTLGNGNKTSVTEVSSSWLSGLYNPHTMHGDVVVDGVRTSTYTEAVHPKLAHILLSPLRAMYTAGVTFGQGFNAFSKNMPQWVREAISA